ncbi:MAG: transcriptional repressor, partial [Geodermatophilaceae bacterium]|nr:transcriptional repressor [Geodermatophilaceae bacterium]
DAARRSEHVMVADVARRARASLGSLSMQATYDCLAVLTRAELVRRIELPGQPARYEGRVGDNHHHLVCRDCGEITDISCAVGAAPCLTPAGGMPFVVDEAEVTFWGRCATCVELNVPSTAY